MRVLLSIKPEFVRKIRTGEKKFEYRKVIFKRPVDTVVVYSTKPVGKVVGEFKVNDILQQAPDELWEKTKEHSGISKDIFDSYFSKSSIGYAIQFKEFQEYGEPLELCEIQDNLKAPQSFVYLS